MTERKVSRYEDWCPCKKEVSHTPGPHHAADCFRYRPFLVTVEEKCVECGCAVDNHSSLCKHSDFAPPKNHEAAHRGLSNTVPTPEKMGKLESLLLAAIAVLGADKHAEPPYTDPHFPVEPDKHNSSLTRSAAIILRVAMEIIKDG